MTERWVLIIDENDKVEKMLGPYANERMAEKADSGVNRNLNHERYLTRIVDCPHELHDAVKCLLCAADQGRGKKKR